MLAPGIEAFLGRYVDGLKESGDVRDAAVERAFRRVPRHLFVARFFVGNESDGWTEVDHDPDRPLPEHLEKIYSGAALITRLQDNLGTSSSSQPALMADMLQLLDVRPGARVLEIGAGTGYNAALLAELTGDASCVTTIDIQPDVVEQAQQSLARAGYGGVRVLCRDGFAGAPEAAPFDRIVATVGCPDLSPAWAEQLAPDGFMLIPLRHAGANPLVRVSRRGERGKTQLDGRVVSFSGFMAMQGALADPAYYDFTRPTTTVGEGETERALWPDLGKARLGFWFYLGVCDARNRVFRWLTSFGLKDERTGRTARVEEDRLIGDPALLDELDTRYQEWRALDAPGMRDWRVRFASGESGADDLLDSGGGEGRWTHRGRHHARQWVLARGESAAEH